MKHRRWVLGLLLSLSLSSLAACGTSGVSDDPSNDAVTVHSEASAEVPRFELGEDLYIRKVQDGVFVITHAFPWPANSMVVEMANSELVLVDTPYTPEATKRALEWIEQRLGERDVTAINTGFHYDNLGGNSYLIEQGIPIYGAALTRDLLAERGEAVRSMTLEWLQGAEYQRYREGHATLPYRAPTHLFELADGLTLDFGGEAVHVYYPGATHAPDNVAVHFPERRLLFGGCMILGGDKVGNTADADLAAWPASVRTLNRFDVDVLVPGHGERLDPGLLDHTLTLLADVQE